MFGSISWREPSRAAGLAPFFAVRLRIPSRIVAERNSFDERLARLTVTRFVAAFIVVMFHFGGDVFTPGSIAAKILRSGPAAVSYFFVLSGFVMACAYGMRAMNVREFWVARFARIYPVYVLGLLVSLWLGARNSLFDWAVCLTLLQAWVPGHELAINAPGWSLSVEMFFYLLFPLLAACMHRHLYAMTFLVFCFWVLSGWAHSQVLQGGGISPVQTLRSFSLYFPLFHLSSFLAGAVAGYWTIKAFKSAHSYAWDGLALGALAAICAALMYRRSLEAWLGGPIAYETGALSPLFAVAIMSIVLGKGRWLNAMSRPVLVRLGEASYAMYILQLPVVLFFMHHVFRDSAPMGPGHFSIYFAALVVTSLAVYVLFEAPMRELLRQRLSEGGPLRPAVLQRIIGGLLTAVSSLPVRLRNGTPQVLRSG